MTYTGAVTPTYDSNGNLTYDGIYNYTWDGEGRLATLGGNAETYDALNRRVEQYNGSAYTEIVYGPAGNKMALMNGQTVTKVFAPLSAGATAVYNSSGLAYYRHPDWLGSSRIASTPSRTIYYDGAYAPFGENYAETGTTDRSFTGQNQDLTPGSSGLLYDFPYREQHSTEGRWISPDPAGINAVDPTNPQSWNRYAYVLNNPLGNVDPLGLDATAYQWIGKCLYQSDGTNSTTSGPGGIIITTETWSPWSLLWCAGGSPVGAAAALGGGGGGGGGASKATCTPRQTGPVHTGRRLHGRSLMKRVLVLFLASLCATETRAVDPPEHKITSDQAKALVLASLTAQQRQLPRVEAEPYDAPGSSKYLLFTVTWEGTPNGSVVVGNYAVDPYTGDVFSSTSECYEEKNKRLEALQAQVRAKLHMSQSEYRRLKTKGPLCEQ
jgi:RHS repeat-associated protein